MTRTLLTSDAKEALRKAIRALRPQLLEQIGDATRSAYRLDVPVEKAQLPESRLRRRERLEAWLAEEVRAERGESAPAEKPGGKGKGKGAAKASSKSASKGAPASSGTGRHLRDAVKEAAYTLLHRLVLLRIMEHHGLSKPAVVTGGWKSAAYANEFVHFAGPLAAVASGEQSATADDTRGYRELLDAVFAEHALDLPGLFGNTGVAALLPIPSQTLRGVIDALNEPALESAWGDDTTLGWVYQYWNDPEREALDAKIADGGKIAPHEIASKTQMFTERYMVEWLLQNSLGLTWLAICRKNGWTPDVEREGVLAGLDARRAEWRAKREAGEVALDALMPIAPGLESDWKYWVPQPIPDDAVAKAPASIRDLRLLDPACGSGHFLVIAFDLLSRMAEEEARHRGVDWSRREIAETILATNLHGIDIDPRATQIAAAALWLQAKLYAPDAEPTRMNLVAPAFHLAGLPQDDPALAALVGELAPLGIAREVTLSLVEGLRGVGHLGSLLRVDRDIAKLVEAGVMAHTGSLFAHAASTMRSELEGALATFLDAHAAEADLGLRLGAEQIAAGLRFVQLVKEGTYDVVVGNPPYQGLSKTEKFEYVTKNYPRGKADLYAAFLERGLELVREGGISALVTMRGWMFLGQFTELRKWILEEHDLAALGDLGTGAFSMRSMDDVISTSLVVVLRGRPDGRAFAVKAAPLADPRRDAGKPARRRAALECQEEVFEFDPKGFAVIEGEPIVYWWTKEFLARYAAAPKVADVSPARVGLQTGDNPRFVRLAWESATVTEFGSWSFFVKGAEGRAWFEPATYLIRWDWYGLQVQLHAGAVVRNRNYYFRIGVSYSTIGNSFSARVHRRPSVLGDMGSAVFPVDLVACVTAFNSSRSRFILSSLNPTVHFTSSDVDKLALEYSAGADVVWRHLEEAFDAHESSREPSIEFLCPGPTAWRYAQDWAQCAVDRPEGEPLPPYEPEYDPPAPEAYVSFAIGVALGRFGANGEGLLDPEACSLKPEASLLPDGILFVAPDDALPDSLIHPASARITDAWTVHGAAITDGKSAPLREWLRKDFFAYHKGLYETRPIYFPLSSEKRSFVAWVSIHRWTDRTLGVLLADHLMPVLRQLDGEIADLNTQRATLDKKAAGAAEKKYGTVKKHRDELADFIAKVREIAERGAPPAETGGAGRHADATFHMDLDDGVMINSAALWPLLQPQWSDPKKWWKQLCEAQGKKDYDWAHLAKRYFPERVDEKCRHDPSLAVAHGCFWKYHPAKAFAWELRLQDEIRPGFTIDEDGSDAARAAWVGAHPEEAEAAREKERVRRERKAAKAADDVDDVGGDAGEEGGGVDAADDEG